jgi:hypothetical protein
MGKRAPYIRQSDVGAGLTRVSLSFSFLFSFFLTILSLDGCAIIPAKHPTSIALRQKKKEKKRKGI